MIDEDTRQLLLLIHLQTESLDHRRMIEAKLRKENKMMMLSSGKMVDVTNLKSEDICIEDIASSISAMSRYAGHTGITVKKESTTGEVFEEFVPKTYSVGAHSIIMWEILHFMNAPNLAKMWGLVHDFSEAYIVDVPRDLKNNPNMKWFRDVEEVVQKQIMGKLFDQKIGNEIFIKLPQPAMHKYPAIDLANALDKEICLSLEMPYLMNRSRTFARDMSDVSNDEIAGVIWALMYRVAIEFTGFQLNLNKPSEWLVSKVKDQLLYDTPHATRTAVKTMYANAKFDYSRTDWEKFTGGSRFP